MYCCWILGKKKNSENILTKIKAEHGSVVSAALHYWII